MEKSISLWDRLTNWIGTNKGKYRKVRRDVRAIQRLVAKISHDLKLDPSRVYNIAEVTDYLEHGTDEFPKDFQGGDVDKVTKVLDKILKEFKTENEKAYDALQQVSQVEWNKITQLKDVGNHIRSIHDKMPEGDAKKVWETLLVEIEQRIKKVHDDVNIEIKRLDSMRTQKEATLLATNIDEPSILQEMRTWANKERRNVRREDREEKGLIRSMSKRDQLDPVKIKQKLDEYLGRFDTTEKTQFNEVYDVLRLIIFQWRFIDNLSVVVRELKSTGFPANGIEEFTEKLEAENARIDEDLKLIENTGRWLDLKNVRAEAAVR